MSEPAKKRGSEDEPAVRILGRGLRAKRGVHLTLRALRETAGYTQSELAERTGIDQGDISRLEGRENYGDCQVDTLQRYIEAVGGTLDLTASFGGKKFILAGVASAQAGSSANKPSQRAGRKATRR
jgi:transcriptional regulator with XRE-family HTH domain